MSTWITEIPWANTNNASRMGTGLWIPCCSTCGDISSQRHPFTPGSELDAAITATEHACDFPSHGPADPALTAILLKSGCREMTPPQVLKELAADAEQIRKGARQISGVDCWACRGRRKSCDVCGDS